MFNIITSIIIIIIILTIFIISITFLTWGILDLSGITIIIREAKIHYGMTNTGLEPRKKRQYYYRYHAYHLYYYYYYHHIYHCYHPFIIIIIFHIYIIISGHCIITSRSRVVGGRVTWKHE